MVGSGGSAGWRVTLHCCCCGAQYDRWTGRTIPTFYVGEHFTPTVRLDEGRTSAPAFIHLVFIYWFFIDLLFRTYSFDSFIIQALPRR